MSLASKVVVVLGGSSGISPATAKAADAVLFLMKNGFITGITLTVDEAGC